MPPQVDTNLRDAWIALHHAANGTREYHALFWAWDTVFDLCANEPEEAFSFILQVLAHDRSDRIVGSLAAGPLDQLLAWHPHRMIDRVEAEARSDSRFAHLLGGVWQNDIPDDVWRRLEAVTPVRW